VAQDSIKNPAGLSQGSNGGDIFGRKRAGGMNDQLAGGESDDGDISLKIGAHEFEGIGDHPQIGGDGSQPGLGVHSGCHRRSPGSRAFF
jgi:hypothetical protein